MNRTRKALAAAVAVAGLVGVGAFAAPHVQATTTAITVTAPATVQAGHPITFAATANDGSQPTNPRITWYHNFRTYNVANDSVIPVTFDAVSGAYLFTYTPGAGEAGRTETFSVVGGCTRLGCTVTGYASFTVTP